MFKSICGQASSGAYLTCSVERLLANPSELCLQPWARFSAFVRG